MTASRLVVFSAMVVLLGAITLSEGMRMGPTKCCFTFSDRALPIKQLSAYSMTSQQCPKEAVMFKTIKGRLVCAKPTDPWVQDRMKVLDARGLGGQGTL
ncbi:chemokine (C-C motif) ligand 35, duplicate 1 [Triplophysa rosa]|uniref:C-C motif chemokine n=1 Tax=Triplophysa rosa TaxID=992332 RepID=A0A9W7X0G6_TRIRA|nr:chemokine (C-C motif) ligand 35, duplicate 1 [Triplophysa rosa]KAI7812145.1 chemokine CCL-C25y-like precursor [Triplophysa rosa]